MKDAKLSKKTETVRIALKYTEKLILVAGGDIILGPDTDSWARRRIKIFGFKPGPEYPTYPFHPDAKYMLIAKFAIENRAISRVSFIDALINPETRNWEKQMIAEFRKRRDLVQEIIGHMLGYELGGAFYAAPKTPIHAEEFSERLLKEEGVCVLPVTKLSSGDHGFFDNRVRLAYVTDLEILNEGLKRYRRFTESLSRF